MTTILQNDIARVPRIDDVVSLADGFVKNLTRVAHHLNNNTFNLINNTTSSNATHIKGIANTTMQRNYDYSVTALPLSSTFMPTLKKSAASFLSATALQWLQQHPNSQLPATMKITDSSLAFMTNLTYTNSNVFIPASAGPAIEDDEIRLEHAPQLSNSALMKVYVLSIMALFSLLGNLLTMWNIYKTRLARRSSRHTWSAIYSLIFHLSIADVLVTGFCIIGEAAWCYTVKWLANDITCKLVKLFQMFSLYLSTYVLVLIGVDRWIAVKYPMKSLNMAKRCYRLLGGTYIVSLVLSLPQFFIFRVARGPFIEEFYQCVTHGFYTAEWQEQLYATFTLVFTFLLPLCILFGTYMSTFRTISNSEKMFQGSKLAGYTNKPSSQTNRQRLIHKAKMKSLRISVVIIFAFLICWTPYNVMMLIFMFWNPDKRFGEDLQSAIFFFGMSNSLVNPLIYGAFHLCPMKRKTSKKGNNYNGTYSLNRGDSQRTASMMTAVTQIDGNGRQVRTFRHSTYYRSLSTGSAYKENSSLLQASGQTLPSPTTIDMPITTPTPTKRQSSMKSPHPNQRTFVTSCSGISNSNKTTTTTGTNQPYHNHSTEIIQNDNSMSSISSMERSDDSGEGGGDSTVLNFINNNKQGGVTNMKKIASERSEYNTIGLQPLLTGADENVTSV